MKNLKYSLIISLAMIMSSCSSWLDVPSKDKVLESSIYESKEGFLKALNGVYVELVAQSLYGCDLSYGMVDVMAQYYSAKNNSNNYYYSYANYAYTEDNVKTKVDTIWSKSYNLIANCNIILDHCADHNGVLPKSYESMIKGEALALRAMLHLDVLRLFGSTYSDNTKGEKVMPYVTSSVQENSPLNSSEEVINLIISDLASAEQLLATCDPVITEGVRNYPNNEGSNDMFYRQYRLNYYAVQALLARANLWKGETAEASRYANLVINDGESKFPFTPLNEIDNANTSNRVFSTEVLFGLYNMRRSTSFDNRFSFKLEPFAILTVADKARLDELCRDENDVRRKMWLTDATHKYYFRKFEEVFNGDGVSDAFRYMMPLIRMSEMYLIAAETTTDITYAQKCINKIKAARNGIDITLTEENKEVAVMEEFRREVICEGQMFFYYKRKGYKNIPNGGTATGTINMDVKQYVLPLPESETSQRGE